MKRVIFDSDVLFRCLSTAAALFCTVEVYVDSGATYTLIQAREIDETSFDYRSGKRVVIQVGSGSVITIYLHQLQVQLGSELLLCPVGISEQLGIRLNVLGKIGIFDRFKVCFQQPQGVLTFEKIEETRS